MGRWVMETIVGNLRNTIVLLASLLGFAAQAAPYIPLGTVDREASSESAVENVYRAGASVAIPGITHAAKELPEADPAKELFHGPRWREDASSRGERTTAETDPEASQDQLAAVDVGRARSGARVELTQRLAHRTSRSMSRPDHAAAPATTIIP